jgi:hypothetical protein
MATTTRLHPLAKEALKTLQASLESEEGRKLVERRSCLHLYTARPQLKRLEC